MEKIKIKKGEHLIAIGDTHGRNLWEKIVEKEIKADKIIFMGDYFDTHDDVSVKKQIENFEKILAFKKANMKKVVLLIGNHDFHYLTTAQETYSGFSGNNFNDINEILQPAIEEKLLQMCFVHKKYLFTHAGVTKTWVNNSLIDLDNIQDSINEKFLTEPNMFRFNIGVNGDNSGDDVTQGPIWVRIPSLLLNMVIGYTFVVGHSTIKELTIREKLIGIDTIGTSGEYLEIINLIPKAKKITDD